MVKSPDTEHVFSLPDRRLVRTLWLGVAAAVALVYAVWGFWTGAEVDTGWPMVSRFIIGAFWSTGAYHCASRCRGTWRDYRDRNDAPRIEQIDSPQ